MVLKNEFTCVPSINDGTVKFLKEIIAVLESHENDSSIKEQLFNLNTTYLTEDSKIDLESAYGIALCGFSSNGESFNTSVGKWKSLEEHFALLKVKLGNKLDSWYWLGKVFINNKEIIRIAIWRPAHINDYFLILHPTLLEKINELASVSDVHKRHLNVTLFKLFKKVVQQLQQAVNNVNNGRLSSKRTEPSFTFVERRSKYDPVNLWIDKVVSWIENQNAEEQARLNKL